MKPFWRRTAGEPSPASASGSTRPLARRFTYRYALALAIISGLALWAFWLDSQTMDEIDQANRELRAVNEQQGRIDQIVGDAADLVATVNGDGEPSDNDEALYREQIGGLEQTQEALMEGSEARNLPGDPSGDLAELYFGVESQLDQEIQAFATLAATLPGFLEPGTPPTERESILNQLRAGADPVNGKIAQGLDRAVDLYTTEIAQTIDERQATNQLMLFLYIMMLTFIVLGVFRPMANSIQIETTSLLDAERNQRENNERQMFHNELNQALEGTENEEEVLEAVARAMHEIVVEAPGELLLVDASGAHLRQAQVNPGAPAPNCPVDSPQACAAIRRGQTVSFETSRALNVCPKLAQHEAGPCSAVCAPVMFLGRAIGVLHVTGKDTTPADSTSIERLNVLASETGNRLGTMRAALQTELQASTDGLTGLPNRRSLEQAARDLISVRRPFTIAMADLDHFKDLNDNFGHESGDRALKLFAQTLRKNLRPDDVAARYGGEEFVLLLPNTSLEESKGALDRLRVTLAGEIAASGSAPFTASWGLATSASGNTFDEMLVAADEALYAAKRAGRNRIIIGTNNEGYDPNVGRSDDGDHPVPPEVVDDSRCPSCGNTSPDGSRFCLECGTDLLPSPEIA